MNPNQSKNGLLGSDDRLKKSAAEDVRGMRSATEDAGREQTDGTVLSREERLRAFRNEFVQEALPSLPSKPGWHYCWLTTTNPMDPIHRRIRMGYQLVRAETIPGFELYKMKSGQYEGFIGVNEMLLAEIPQELYQDIMTTLHHIMPNELAESIKAREQQLRELGGGIGRDAPIIASLTEEGELGTGALSNKPPVFAN